MKFETKFNLNQDVYVISKYPKSNVVTCPQCSGKGRFTWSNGESQICSRCFGIGTTTVYQKNAWHISGNYRVGQITVSVTSIKGNEEVTNYGEYDPDNIITEEKVMCYESGISSGTVYTRGENIFAPRVEAQAECDSLNTKEQE